MLRRGGVTEVAHFFNKEKENGHVIIKAVLSREGGDIGLFITLVAKVL